MQTCQQDCRFAEKPAAQNLNAYRSCIGDKYVLPTGAADAARLDVIHEVYGPISFRGLEAAGIGEAHRAADIGCGTGTMSRWLAERMGDGSKVDAVDISEDQLEVARTMQPAAGAGAITYSLASAYELAATGLHAALNDGSAFRPVAQPAQPGIQAENSSLS